MRIGGSPQTVQTSLLSQLKPAADVMKLTAAVGAAAEPAQPMAGALSPNTSVEMLVMLSSVIANDDRLREHRRHAGQALDRLDELRRELLKGNVERETLDALSGWLAEAPAPDDPEMASLFQDIEIRVRVELAKLDLET